jgi:hypothetical protein
VTQRERVRANAHALGADGMSIRQIAQRLGYPRSTVGDWLRGDGEWFEIRTCALCGERFVPITGRQVFCTAEHAAKYARVFGGWQARGMYDERREAA